MASLITRRKLLLGLAATTALAGCDSRPASMFLAGMERWNERVDRLLFSPNRLASEPPASELTPEADFPSYFISDTIPFAPDNWTLKVGGLVARPSVFSLEQLKRMPQTGMRIRHHCVEGWSAVAEWQGVQLREIAQDGRRQPRRAVRRVPFIRRRLLFIVGYRKLASSADHSCLRHEWARAISRSRRSAAPLLARQARLQEREVPDRS